MKLDEALNIVENGRAIHRGSWAKNVRLALCGKKLVLQHKAENCSYSDTSVWWQPDLLEEMRATDWEEFLDLYVVAIGCESIAVDGADDDEQTVINAFMTRGVSSSNSRVPFSITSKRTRKTAYGCLLVKDGRLCVEWLSPSSKAAWKRAR